MRTLRDFPIRSILALIFVAASVAACGDDGGSTGTDDDASFSGTIRIVDNRFSPADVTVAPGDSVTWRWEGSLGHSVTQGTSPDPAQDASRLFDSGTRVSGTFGYRFTAAGDVQYFCRPHFAAGMRGVVRVRTR